MKRVKFLFLAFLPVLLLSCGFVEKTKMENKVGEKFISELSDAGFSDIVSTCDILADLGSKESDGSYSGKIIITDAETGYSDALPICAWMDGEEVVMLIEAMKMENEITATKDGTLVAVLAPKGTQVQVGTALFEIA